MPAVRHVTTLIALFGAQLAAISISAEERDPTDPEASVPSTHYHSVLSGYDSKPVTSPPGDWKELNDRMERIGGPLGQLKEPHEPLRKKKKQ